MKHVKEIENTEQFRALLNELLAMRSFRPIDKDRPIFGAAIYAAYGGISGIFFQVEGTPDGGTFIFRYNDKKDVRLIATTYRGTLCKIYTNPSSANHAFRAAQIAEEIASKI